MRLELNCECLLVSRKGLPTLRVSLLGLLRAWDNGELMPSDRVMDTESKMQFPACAAMEVYEFSIAEGTSVSSDTALLLTSMLRKHRYAELYRYAAA